MVMGSMLAAYGEGLSLAQASGLDASQLLQVLELGVCGAPLLKLKGAKMLAGDHAPNFPLKHAEKDMRLACELGSKSGVKLPVAATADATCGCRVATAEATCGSMAAMAEAMCGWS